MGKKKRKIRNLLLLSPLFTFFPMPLRSVISFPGLPQPFLQFEASYVRNHSTWILFHTSSSLPCSPLLHSFQVGLHVILSYSDAAFEEGERIPEYQEHRGMFKGREIFFEEKTY